MLTLLLQVRLTLQQLCHPSTFPWSSTTCLLQAHRDQFSVLGRDQLVALLGVRLKNSRGLTDTLLAVLLCQIVADRNVVACFASFFRCRAR